MSELDRPSLDEGTKMPKEQKIKIAIAIVLCVVLGTLMFMAMCRVDAPSAQTPIETLPEEEIEFDNMHVAKSSWRDGAWCAVQKDAVKAIHVVTEYKGNSVSAWTIDEMVFYFTEEGEVYIAVGPGVHMVGSMHRAFADFINATQLTGLELLETSLVTDMSYLFTNSAFESIDISTWDTGSVSNFSHMLYETHQTYSVNMDNLDLSNVVDASYLFANCTAVSELSLRNVDTSHILNMDSMFMNVGANAFKGATALYGTIDTSSCVNMAHMFDTARLTNMTALTKTFNTANVTNMEAMFYHSLNLYELDLSGWDVSKVTNMTDMFNDIICLKYLNMEGWAPSSLEKADRMFRNCNNLLAFNQWGAAPKIQSTESMFENCFEMKDLDITCFDGATIENAEKMFYGLENVSHIYCNGFSVVNHAYDMFAWCISIASPTAYDRMNISSDMANTDGYFTSTK